MKTLTLLLTLLLTTTVFAKLPKKIQADQYTLKALQEKQAKNYTEALKYFKKVIDSKLKQEVDFYFEYGETAFLILKNDFMAKEVSPEETTKIFSKFLTMTKNKDENYMKALDYLNQLEDIKKNRKVMKIGGGCSNSICYILPGKGLNAFKMDKYEVTVAEFKKCVNAGKCSKSNFKTKSDHEYYNYGNSSRDNHPMNGVNWYGAKEYCSFVGKRLPTEAEWKYAAYGTDGRKYPWGNEEASCYYAVMDDGDKHGGRYSDGCGKNRTWPVGSKEAGKSPFGLYDMGGNVWEWCSDYYVVDYYKNSPKNNPQGGSTSARRVLRGGGWSSESGYLRSSNRSGNEPTLMNSSRGFRCVKSQ